MKLGSEWRSEIKFCQAKMRGEDFKGCFNYLMWKNDGKRGGVIFRNYCYNIIIYVIMHNHTMIAGPGVA